MNGNSSYRHSNAAVLSIVAIEAPVVVTSADFDARLSDAYARFGVRPGVLEGLAGIRERRWWPEDTSFIDGAVTAGGKALAQSGIDPSRIGLMINSSVNRTYLEPSTAVAMHHRLDLPPSAVNFDLSNACLGFVNGIHLAATMIDAGQLEYALIVDSEDARATQEATIARLSDPAATVQDFFNEFATLTLGSGAAAMVLGPADRHPEGHRVVSGITRAGTEHHDLCVGDMNGMRTDTQGLLDAGLQLAEDAWKEALVDHDWQTADRFILHQVSSVHTNALCDRLGLDQTKVPLTFPTFGNIGPAALPFTLAREVDHLSPGDQVLCMGIGSGLNTAFLELSW
jgi:3-oxoacyl-[acyl-carrier-protein] synthase-3